MESSKVSIIVPVYNTEQFLPSCIDSILAQDYNNIEIVLINDGSKDKSLVICKEYSQKHDNIILIDKENTGQADSRYVGFRRSSGDYIFCVDSDDTIEPDAVSSLVHGLEEIDADMFYGRFRLVDEVGHELKQTSEYSISSIEGSSKIAEDALWSTNIKASLCIKLCKRSLWENCYTDEVRAIHFNEDYLLTVLMAINSNRVGFSNKVIYNALQRAGSISRNVRPEMLTAHDDYFDLIRTKLSEQKLADIEYSVHGGFAKNIYYCLVLIAQRCVSYKSFKDLINMIPSDSILHSKAYRKDLLKMPKSYLALDTLSKCPWLFYKTMKIVSRVFKH